MYAIEVMDVDGKWYWYATYRNEDRAYARMIEMRANGANVRVQAA